MKAKFKVAKGNCVTEYHGSNVTLEEAIDLLQREEVISISIVKQTPRQYFDAQKRAKKEEPT